MWNVSNKTTVLCLKCSSTPTHSNCCGRPVLKVQQTALPPPHITNKSLEELLLIMKYLLKLKKKNPYLCFLFTTHLQQWKEKTADSVCSSYCSTTEHRESLQKKTKEEIKHSSDNPAATASLPHHLLLQSSQMEEMRRVKVTPLCRLLDNSSDSLGSRHDAAAVCALGIGGAPQKTKK